MDNYYALPPLLQNLADAITENKGIHDITIHYVMGLAYAMGKSDGKLELANSYLGRISIGGPIAEFGKHI